ncbi:MAG: septum formation initiator family protein [Gemmatimonadetes bacterium]|nr:septum formation initiator family protein [Gemmatimonadota bacterium]
MRRLVFLGLLAFAGYFAVFGGEYSALDARRARAELATRRAEVTVEERRIDSLQARIDSLRHNDEALERLARERYGLIRDGELLYRLTDTERGEESEESPPEDPR